MLLLFTFVSSIYYIFILGLNSILYGSTFLLTFNICLYTDHIFVICAAIFYRFAVFQQSLHQYLILIKLIYMYIYLCVISSIIRYIFLHYLGFKIFSFVYIWGTWRNGGLACEITRLNFINNTSI